MNDKRCGCSVKDSILDSSNCKYHALVVRINDLEERQILLKEKYMALKTQVTNYIDEILKIT